MTAAPAEELGSFLQLVRKTKVLSLPQLQLLVEHLLPRLGSVRALGGELIRRGWLTPFQVNQLALGRSGNLTLGQYQLLERLGKGGMGEVFKARHPQMNRLAAVKLIASHRLAKPRAQQRFQLEIQAMARLCHPNIVHAFDADRVGNWYYLAMEFVEGRTLSDLVDRTGPLPVAVVCDYGRQIALALQHAHELKLVHRDVKPSNVMVTPQRQIKVLDFGLARVALESEEDSGLTRRGQLLGTTDYMAPEQALDPHRADIRADLYSLGCTLYHLLTGQVPFPEGSKIEKAIRHMKERPRPIEELRPAVPQQVAGVIRQLMRHRRRDRFQTPVEAAIALAKAATDAPLAAPTERLCRDTMC